MKGNISQQFLAAKGQQLAKVGDRCIVRPMRCIVRPTSQFAAMCQELGNILTANTFECRILKRSRATLSRGGNNRKPLQRCVPRKLFKPKCHATIESPSTYCCVVSPFVNKVGIASIHAGSFLVIIVPTSCQQSVKLQRQSSLLSADRSTDEEKSIPQTATATLITVVAADRQRQIAQISRRISELVGSLALALHLKSMDYTFKSTDVLAFCAITVLYQHGVGKQLGLQTLELRKNGNSAQILDHVYIGCSLRSILMIDQSVSQTSLFS